VVRICDEGETADDVTCAKRGINMIPGGHKYSLNMKDSIAILWSKLQPKK